MKIYTKNKNKWFSNDIPLDIMSKILNEEDKDLVNDEIGIDKDFK